VAEQGGLPCCCLGPSAALPLHRRRLQGDDDRTAQRRQLVEAPAQELDGPVRPVAAPLVLPARRRDEGLAQHRVAVDAFRVYRPPLTVSGCPSMACTACRLRSLGSKSQRRRQQAPPNSRNFRSLALSPRNSSIGFGSVQVSHSASVIASPSATSPACRVSRPGPPVQRLRPPSRPPTTATSPRIGSPVRS